MTQENSSTPVGSDRLEEMTGDRRKGKRAPGVGFWFFFCLLFAAASVTAIWLIGGLIKGGVENIKGEPENPAITEPLAPSEDRENKNQDTAPVPNENKPTEADELSSALQTQPQTAAQNEKKPMTIGETDIYKDENGVWRNLNRGDENMAVKSSAARPDPLTTIGAESRSGAPEAASPAFMIMSAMSGLLSPEGGGTQNSGGLGQLIGLLGALGGLDLPNQSGQAQSNGGLSQMLEHLSGVLDSSGSNGRPPLRQFPGGLETFGQSQSSPPPNNKSQEIRRQMAAKTREDERRIQELKAMQQKSQSTNRIENFEGFERFDPKDAKNITSSWEYFDDPR